jgi:phosphoribosyl 1,2-cyclic phosphodiesterase
MKLKCIATGSTGNCYILTSNGGETLILDCGIPIMEIKKALNWNIKDVVGVLCTHHHLDHSKSVKDFRKIGISIYGLYSEVAYMRTMKIGEFITKPFDLTTIDGNWTHTDAEGTPCPIYGFMIEHPEIGRMLYITDCEFVKWRFKNVNHILLGVNYDTELLSGDDAKKNHVVRGHMSIDTACDFVKANASDRLQNVIMCHLSKENADAGKFIEKMKKVAYGANVDVAVAGKSWDLKNPSECPF